MLQTSPARGPTVDLGQPILTICGIVTNVANDLAETLMTPHARQNGSMLFLADWPPLFDQIATRETVGELAISRFSQEEIYLARLVQRPEGRFLAILSAEEEERVRAMRAHDPTRLPFGLRVLSTELSLETHPLPADLRATASLTASLLAEGIEKLEEALKLPHGAVGWRLEGTLFTGYMDTLARGLADRDRCPLMDGERERIASSSSNTLLELSNMLLAIDQTLAMAPVFRSGWSMRAPS